MRIYISAASNCAFETRNSNAFLEISKYFHWQSADGDRFTLFCFFSLSKIDFFPIPIAILKYSKRREKMAKLFLKRIFTSNIDAPDDEEFLPFFNRHCRRMIYF